MTRTQLIAIAVLLLLFVGARVADIYYVTPAVEQMQLTAGPTPVEKPADASPAAPHATETPKVAPSTKPAPEVAPRPVYAVGIVGEDITTQNIITGVNNERIEAGLAPLTENATLDAAAQAKLDDMLAKNYFAHISPEGLNSWYWFQKVGYPYKAAGENLARNYGTTQETVAAWMASPTHKANIVKGIYTETGVAVSGSIVVQLFASK